MECGQRDWHRLFDLPKMNMEEEVAVTDGAEEETIEVRLCDHCDKQWFFPCRHEWCNKKVHVSELSCVKRNIFCAEHNKICQYCHRLHPSTSCPLIENGLPLKLVPNSSGKRKRGPKRRLVSYQFDNDGKKTMKRKCPICGLFVSSVKYSSHVERCSQYVMPLYKKITTAAVYTVTNNGISNRDDQFPATRRSSPFTSFGTGVNTVKKMQEHDLFLQDGSRSMSVPADYHFGGNDFSPKRRRSDFNSSFEEFTSDNLLKRQVAHWKTKAQSLDEKNVKLSCEIEMLEKQLQSSMVLEKKPTLQQICCLVDMFFGTDRDSSEEVKKILHQGHQKAE